MYCKSKISVSDIQEKGDIQRMKSTAAVEIKTPLSRALLPGGHCILSPPPSALPACGISRAPHLCFSPSVRTTLKCCFRYPWVSPIKAAPSPQRYCFLRMIDWWMRADTSMKPFPLASLSDDVQRIFSIHASLLACVIPGTSFTPCSLKDLF